MCKMIGFSHLPKGIKEAKLNSLLVKAAKLLGESQRDGFGVAISHGKQKVYRERHLTASTFNGLGSMHWSVSVLPKGLRTKLKDGVDFDQYGKIPNLNDGTGPVVLHGRTATCAKQISNTHPFIKMDDRLGNIWTMAHNGVVEWEADEKLPLETTCDSEHLLNCYVHLNGEESFKGRISGYAATLGITPHGEFFCFRDNRAPLYVCYSQELDLSILASDDEHAWQLMTEVCKLTKTKLSKVGEPMMLDDWTAHTWTNSDGVISQTIQPFESGYGKISSTYVSKAFGTDSYGSGYYGSSYGSSTYGKSSYPDTSSKTVSPGFKQIDEETKRLTQELRLQQEELPIATQSSRSPDLDKFITKVEANPNNYTAELREQVRKIKNRKRISERKRARLMLNGDQSNQPMTTEEYNYILYGEENLSNIPASSGHTDIDMLTEEEWKKLSEEISTEDGAI